MKKYIIQAILAGSVFLAGALPALATPPAYVPTIESQHEQVNYILALVQSLPSYTNEQLTQKISLLQQALQLQLQVNQQQLQPGLPLPLYQTGYIGSLYPAYGPAGTRVNFLGSVGIAVNDRIQIRYNGRLYFLSEGVDPGLGFIFPIELDSTQLVTGSYSISVLNTANVASNALDFLVTSNATPIIQGSSSITTGGVDQGTPTSARMLGYVSRAGNAADTISAWFEWSTDPYLDGAYNMNIIKATAKSSFQLQSGTVNTWAMLSNIPPSTTYYYRLVISSGTGGTQKGDVKSFTTSPQYQYSYYY